MKALVLGLGVSGRSVVRYLRARGVDVAVSEYRQGSQLTAEERDFLAEMAVRLETGGHTGRFLADADLVVAGPGVPGNVDVLAAARDMGIPVLGELALAAGQFRSPVIAVTGSNGKTTVTGLIGTLLEAGGYTVFVGGNIGTPLLDYCTDQVEADFVVLELSSFQLERAGDFRADIGLLLNISPDHLDRHGSLDRYTAAKYRIFGGQRVDDTAILGGDDPLVMAAAERIRAGIRLFGHGADCEALVRGSRVLVSEAAGAVLEFELAETRLDTAVNHLNAAAAILAARAAGCSAEGIRQGLALFQPPEHRMTLVGERDGILWINDSKATNVGALKAALASCTKPVVLIAGGRDKGSDFSVLRDLMQEKVRSLILLGEAAETMAGVLADTVDVRRAGDMDEAVRLAAASALPGDIVLLAPGCASFDMFDDYAQRGRVFTRLVRELIAAGVENDPDKRQTGREERR